MARFVIAPRSAGGSSGMAKAKAAVAMSHLLGSLSPAVALSDQDSSGPSMLAARVIDADPATIDRMKAKLPPDVLVEEEILHWPDLVPPRDVVPVRQPSAAAMTAAAATATATAFTITVTGGGKPLPHANVSVYLRRWPGWTEPLQGRTDRTGQCQFQLLPGYQPSAAVIIPAGGFWTMTARGMELWAPIECPPLPADGPLSWWHRICGLQTFDLRRGSGIRVGVVDTGAGPHPNLAHVTLTGAFIGGEVLPGNAARDVDSHGSHVAGTIGARPVGQGDFGGMAPGCDLFAARVFPSPAEAASNADIRNAIDELSQVHEVDLINLSLGSQVPSEIVHDAIIAAFERGTLCICSAGNEAGNVIYPAAFPESVAVSALGLAGWGPKGSLSASRLPADSSRFGHDNLYLANFSCYGPEVECSAPGVGIIATVPNHHGEDPLHGAMDGTSMASPVACGALAALLASNTSYMALPRDSRRARAARSILQEHARSIGLDTVYQGRGVPYL